MYGLITAFVAGLFVGPIVILAAAHLSGWLNRDRRSRVPLSRERLQMLVDKTGSHL